MYLRQNVIEIELLELNQLELELNQQFLSLKYFKISSKEVI